MVANCKFCRQIMPLSMFNKNKTRKSGVDNVCKKCRVNRKTKHINTCEQCGFEFITNRKKSKYCNSHCSHLGRRRRMKANCDSCGAEIDVIESHYKSREYNYCNQDCRTLHLSEIMKSEGNHNYNRVPYNCDGCDKLIKVVPSRIENQKYVFCTNNCYKNNIGKYFSGIKNGFYNHGLTDEERLSTRRYKEYYEWRTSVYERDGYTCQSCFDDKGGNLVAHHILNYSEHEDLRVDVENGITLCKTCHVNFHKEYGYRNNNEKQLKDFLERTLIPL